MEKIMKFVTEFLNKRPSFSILGFGVLLLSVAILVSIGFKAFIFMLAIALIFLGWMFGVVREKDRY